MELKELIHPLEVLEVVGNTDVEISGIQSDSRKVEKGFLFVAVRGTTVDGHDYIQSAIGKGAAAIVCEEIPALSDEDIQVSESKPVFIRVKDSADALGKSLSAWYENPSDNLILVGVTGTNGKTTIATLLYEMFRKMGHKVGLLSTVCNYIDGEAIPTDHTTPDPVTLHNLMARMVEAGCEYAFMEVSSHSIDQKRISGLSFNGGIFTNLTRDHLDYHKTVENYLKAKKKFFDDLPASAFALTNADDKAGLVMLQNTAARKLTYSLRTLADFKGKILESHFEGTEMLVNGREVMTRFVGRFNAYNLLAVYGAAGNGRVITVVGCGGNRDKGKRPIMAKEAAKLSDQLILTSDNPRFEEPDEIIKDMVAGLNAADMEHTLCITDRTQAIKTATMLARKGDVILVAGKGHEDYQEVKGVKHHFDDREQLKEIFKS